MKLGWEILPGKLYQRGLFGPAPVEAKVAALREGNVGAMAVLVRKPDPEVAAWLEAEGGVYVYRPISDGKNVEVGFLEMLACEMAQVIRGGKAVITQCRAGRNRSGLLSALIIRELEGVSGAEALAHVQRIRPNALYNPHFCEYLRSLP
jgi:protein-tyrosine phosphatase